MKPAVIEVAINGATKRERNPNVPITPQEIADESARLIAAGAAVIHNHNQDIRLVGEAAAEQYGAGWAPVLERYPEAIFCPAGALAPSAEEKVAHLAPCARAGARMGVLDPGSLNLASTAADGAPGDRRFAYINDFDSIDTTVTALDQAGLGASISIYEPGFLRATLAYHRAGRLRQGAMVKLYFAGKHDLLSDRPLAAGTTALNFGLPPTRAALEAYLEMLEGSDLPWTVAVLGGDAVESGMIRLALERGGHIRVGIEDYVGSATPRNEELLAAALVECRAVGRAPATLREAAEIMKLSRG